MGIFDKVKDFADKTVSYFDTDDVTNVEETIEETSVRQTTKQPVKQESAPKVEPSLERPAPQRVQAQARPAQSSQTSAGPTRTQAVRNQEPMTRQAANHGQATTTIVLKYPRKYEDAQEIVERLIVNECVLIDFQYMLDAQARRCLDYIDGASKVLYGTLQKVSGSMYLLTPSNVVVDFEEANIPNNGQDINFDYDMKRR